MILQSRGELSFSSRMRFFIVFIFSPPHAHSSKISSHKHKSLGFDPSSDLAQGLLTKKYLHGIPEHSRAARSTGFLKVDQVTEDKVGKARRLDEIAARRGQTLAEMALAWVLKDERMTSVIVGTSSVKQLADNLHALDNLNFTNEELAEIEGILRL